MYTEVMFDLNNLAYRTFFGMKEVGAGTENPDYGLWHYTMFYSIDKFLSSFPNANNVILAVDSGKSWREMMYAPYKGDRKEKRAKQSERDAKAGKHPVDMERFMLEYESFITKAKEHLPFRVIRLTLAEADDIIAVLTQKTLEKHSQSKTIIVSADEDYIQLGVPGRVLIYDPLHQKYRSFGRRDKFLRQKAMIGQSKDNIFNCLTPTKWDTMAEHKGSRKPGFGESAFEKAEEEGFEAFMEAKAKVKITRDKATGRAKPNFYRCWKVWYKRNLKLIDFRLIPSALKNVILKIDEDYVLPPASKFMDYVRENNWPSLIPKMSSIMERYSHIER